MKMEESRSILGTLDLREEAEAEVRALIADGQFEKAGQIANEYGFDDDWLQGLIDEATKARARRIKEAEERRKAALPKVESKPSSFRRDLSAYLRREAEELAEKQRLFEANQRERQQAP